MVKYAEELNVQIELLSVKDINGDAGLMVKNTQLNGKKMSR